ncbi:erythromycin esterase family protein [Sphingosinicella sp. LHD-64]|uniref:erythromycin esterase family protein n=1 Tax=Sphingosinicella sp. LHD-64 TaxID=3072139 RepID=UPI00280D5A1F|nr:erythromycin esterase family protein [Sphingosinicella sp. LHD-64]MDQ8758315.1 erythromycin esterase family protein [Sphingosinicella sp. LHD-64]
MIDQSRRAVLLGGLACAALARGETPASSVSQSDDLRQWLAARAIPLRTIDPEADDLSDLEPLIHAIGDARIVQLGEPSHGAGSSFAAKVRLIKFLHQRMGFDVVAWESGFYDLRQVQASLRSGADPVAAAQQGILRIWSVSRECRPLFTYAQTTLAGSRPLEMAGFDIQFTAEGSAERFAADLRAVARLSPALRRLAVRPAEQAIAAFDRLDAYSRARARKFAQLSQAGISGEARTEAMASWESEEGGALRSSRSDLIQLERAVQELRTVIRANRRALDRAVGGHGASFLDRALDNLAGFGANLHDRHGADRPARTSGPSVASENRRDALNAENLRWLMEEGYSGRKIVVWAHNAHVMNAYYGPGWDSVSLAPRPGWMKPTGVFLAERLGSAVYTIGITTFSGEDGFAAPMPATPIPAASSTSLEARLHGLGMPFAFLDLRSLRGTPDHPLRPPLSMRLPKYEEEMIPDLTIPYDGIVFIDRMARATRIADA